MLLLPLARPFSLNTMARAALWLLKVRKSLKLWSLHSLITDSFRLGPAPAGMPAQGFVPGNGASFGRGQANNGNYGNGFNGDYQA